MALHCRRASTSHYYVSQRAQSIFIIGLQLLNSHVYSFQLRQINNSPWCRRSISFGAVIIACAAATDRRPKALVIVCLLLSFV